MLKKISTIVVALLIVIAAGGAWFTRGIDVTHPVLKAGNLPPLIPLRELYANTDSRWRHRLSPDGSKLSWLESKWFKPALWVKPLDGDNAEIFHTDDQVRWYGWSSDSRYVVYQADRDGWENDVLVSIDTTTSKAKPRTYDFGKGVKSFFYRFPETPTSKVVIAHNGRDRSRFDLYKLDLDTGKTETIDLSIEEGVNWHLTRDGDVYARTRYVSGADWRFEVLNGKEWREVSRGTFEDTFYPFSDPDQADEVYAVSNLGRDKSALVKVNLTDGKETFIDAHPDVDYGEVYTDVKTQKPVMVTLNPGYQERRYFDKDYEKMVAKVSPPENSAVHLVSRTLDNSKLLIQVQQAEAGYETTLIDNKSGKITPIWTPSIAKRAQDISPVEPVFIKAKDGLKIPAFVSKPKGIDGPAPMVIIIHGGPTARTYWGWNDLRVWLNNRGYAVLDVNYRASWGYGRKFREAAIGEVSRKMDQDITDARQWAVDAGIADPAKVAVFGGSFGGLKVLTAMTRNPNLYAAGVDINGISDLETMLKQVPVYWRGWPDWYRKYIGDPEKPSELKEIKDRSPITHADKLKSPLLIIQGANDVRVIREQADQMVLALRKHKAPLDYILIKDAGHQSRNWGWKQQIITMRAIERFLARHLGGRADGFDYAITGAHILNKL